jgi:hypothetical protein
MVSALEDGWNADFFVWSWGQDLTEEQLGMGGKVDLLREEIEDATLLGDKPGVDQLEEESWSWWSKAYIHDREMKNSWIDLWMKVMTFSDVDWDGIEEAFIYFTDDQRFKRSSGTSKFKERLGESLWEWFKLSEEIQA